MDVLNSTLVTRQDLNDSLSIVCVRPDNSPVPQFIPGQFISLGLPRPMNDKEKALAERFPNMSRRPRLTRRAYSIASAPNQREFLEFFVVRVDEGRLTPQLWDIRENGRLWMDNEVKGEFTIENIPQNKDLVMVSTGTGIAPYVSMLRAYQGQNRWRRFILINGTRRAIDLGYHDELSRIAQEDPSVVYIPIVSREPEDSSWSGLRGRVPVALVDQTYRRLVGAPLDPQDCHVFLCGNPTMIDEQEAALHQRGFTTHTRETPGNIHFERYW